MITIDLLREKIEHLAAALENNSPGYKQYLSEIHSTLLREPEMLHLLKTEEEISVIISGLKRYKQLEIPITVKKAGGANIPKGPIELDMI